MECPSLSKHRITPTVSTTPRPQPARLRHKTLLCSTAGRASCGAEHDRIDHGNEYVKRRV